MTTGSRPTGLVRNISLPVLSSPLQQNSTPPTPVSRGVPRVSSFSTLAKPQFHQLSTTGNSLDDVRQIDGMVPQLLTNHSSNTSSSSQFGLKLPPDNNNKQPAVPQYQPPLPPPELQQIHQQFTRPRRPRPQSLPLSPVQELTNTDDEQSESEAESESNDRIVHDDSSLFEQESINNEDSDSSCEIYSERNISNNASVDGRRRRGKRRAYIEEEEDDEERKELNNRLSSDAPILMYKSSFSKVSYYNTTGLLYSIVNFLSSICYTKRKTENYDENGNKSTNKMSIITFLSTLICHSNSDTNENDKCKLIFISVVSILLFPIYSIFLPIQNNSGNGLSLLIIPILCRLTGSVNISAFALCSYIFIFCCVYYKSAIVLVWISLIPFIIMVTNGKRLASFSAFLVSLFVIIVSNESLVLGIWILFVGIIVSLYNFLFNSSKSQHEFHEKLDHNENGSSIWNFKNDDMHCIDHMIDNGIIGRRKRKIPKKTQQQRSIGEDFSPDRLVPDTVTA